MVANAYGEPFDRIRSETFRENWGRFSYSNVEVFLLSGQKLSTKGKISNLVNERVRHSRIGFIQRFLNRYYSYIALSGVKSEIIGNEILVDVPDKLRYLLHKDIAAFKLLLEYDFILKTTLSSVVQMEHLQKFVNSLQTSIPVVAGTIIKLPSLNLVSGSNLLLNRKAAELILSRIEELDQGFLDDVAISKCISGLVQIANIPSINLGKIDSVFELTDIDIASTLHFRCRSENKIRDDVRIIKSLIQVLRDK